MYQRKKKEEKEKYLRQNKKEENKTKKQKNKRKHKNKTKQKLDQKLKQRTNDDCAFTRSLLYAHGINKVFFD